MVHIHFNIMFIGSRFIGAPFTESRSRSNSILLTYPEGQRPTGAMPAGVKKVGWQGDESAAVVSTSNSNHPPPPHSMLQIARRLLPS